MASTLYAGTAVVIAVIFASTLVSDPETENLTVTTTTLTPGFDTNGDPGVFVLGVTTMPDGSIVNLVLDQVGEGNDVPCSGITIPGVLGCIIHLGE